MLFELLQHVAEVHLGMYASVAAARAGEHHPVRLAFGMLKLIGLIVPGYWIVRSTAWHDLAQAARWDSRSVRLFAGHIAFEIALADFQLFVLPQTIAAALFGLVGGQVIACQPRHGRSRHRWAMRR